MCSLILSFEPTAAWPIIIAANRDERLDRAADPPGPHWPGIIGGRDKVAGGTWFKTAEGLREGEDFFFEKKKQKTFGNLYRDSPPPVTPRP